MTVKEASDDIKKARSIAEIMKKKSLEAKDEHEDDLYYDTYILLIRYASLMEKMELKE